jgi:hypothetical protein
MHEKPRFGLALAGVGGCLCIAAGIIVTAPRGVAIPPVDGVPPARAEHLPPVPMPSWADMAVDVTSRTAAGSGSRIQASPSSNYPSRAPVGAESSVAAVTIAPAAAGRYSPIFEGQSPVPLMLRGAPHAEGSDVVVADSRTRERGAVTGALVTAGTHIGGGFKSVGRTLMRVF